MSGYFRIQRGLFDKEFFRTSQPLSDREAWIWLIEHANWEPKRIRSGYTTFDVPRGALATHYRELAKEWKWDHKKVIRFLGMLKKELMIALETPHRMVQITLCNYDKYQRPWDTDSPEKPHESPTKAPRKPQPYNIEVNTLNEGKKEIQGTEEDEGSDTELPFTRVYDYGCELFPNLAPQDNSPIHQWINGGADVDIDIIPTLKRLHKKGVNPRGWGLFTQDIANAKTRRETPLPKGDSHANNRPSNGTGGRNGIHSGTAEVAGPDHQPPSKWQTAAARVLDKIERGEI